MCLFSSKVLLSILNRREKEVKMKFQCPQFNHVISYDLLSMIYEEEKNEMEAGPGGCSSIEEQSKVINFPTDQRIKWKKKKKKDCLQIAAM